MDKGNIIGILLIIGGVTGLMLEHECKLQSVLNSLIGNNPADIGKFAVSLLVLLVILSLLPEPYSTWLVGLIVLGLVFLDVQRNGSTHSTIWNLGG
jgi:hypothetical protein